MNLWEEPIFVELVGLSIVEDLRAEDLLFFLYMAGDKNSKSTTRKACIAYICDMAYRICTHLHYSYDRLRLFNGEIWCQVTSHQTRHLWCRTAWAGRSFRLVARINDVYGRLRRYTTVSYRAGIKSPLYREALNWPATFLRWSSQVQSVRLLVWRGAVRRCAGVECRGL